MSLFANESKHNNQTMLESLAGLIQDIQDTAPEFVHKYSFSAAYVALVACAVAWMWLKLLYWLIRRPHGESATLGGLENKVLSGHRLDNGAALPFTQSGTRVQISNVPKTDETGLWPALKIECDGAPVVYQAGGLRIPKVPHPHYDPCPSDIAH
jgi:hypothetical protein